VWEAPGEEAEEGASSPRLRIEELGNSGILGLGNSGIKELRD
jgi:hypothetical protein